MADGIHFDGHGLNELGRDLRRASHEVRAEVDKSLGVIGEQIKESAKVLASAHSKTIADTIRVRMVPGAVSVVAGNEQTPIAVLYEVGNKKSKRTATHFRHPVFGHDTWVEQEKHPYLAPALAANRREITKRMEQAWARALAHGKIRVGAGG